MNDRIPADGKAGRMLITPESGAPFYATVTMADEPLQEGTPLNKNSLLKDTTAALLGGNADMVPDEAFVALKALFDGVDALVGTKAKIATGTYKGTGKNGSTGNNTLGFDSPPKIVFVVPSATRTGSAAMIVLVSDNPDGFCIWGSSIHELRTTWSGNSVSWNHYNNFNYQLNESGRTYRYHAIL